MNQFPLAPPTVFRLHHRPAYKPGPHCPPHSLTLHLPHFVPLGLPFALFLSLACGALFASAGATLQRVVSPDGHETCTIECDPIAPRESYNRGTVPLPLVPDWVGTRIRATGALVWFDADADGDQDLFVGTYWANQWPPLADYYNFMYLNVGGMLEDDPSWISSDQKHTGGAEWGYINNDAYPDLFLANGGTSLQACQVFYGRDGLLPTTAGWQNGGGTWATDCSLADFDRDGDLDVATSNQGVSPNPYRPVCVFRNAGNGLETTPFWQSNQVGITDACDWGDMDGDLYPDLAVSGWVDWQSGVFRNLGTTLDRDFIWTTGHPERTDKGVAWADLDRDGHLDLALGGSGYPDWVFRNEGTVLAALPIWSSGESYTGCQDMAWADIDNDGDMDLASIHFSTGHVRIYLNEGGVLPSIADWQYDAASSGSALAFGDVNGDGWLDLAIGVANGPIELFLNQQLPTATNELPGESGGLTVGCDARLSPNPVRASWALSLDTPAATRLGGIDLLDASGRRIARGTDATDLLQRSHAIVWQRALNDLPGGTYLLRAWGSDALGQPWAVRKRVVWLGR